MRFKRSHYRHEIPLDLSAESPDLAPLGTGPLMPENKRPWEGHSAFCTCEHCADLQAAMNRYLAAKKAYIANGFN